MVGKSESLSFSRWVTMGGPPLDAGSLRLTHLGEGAESLFFSGWVTMRLEQLVGEAESLALLGWVIT